MLKTLEREYLAEDVGTKKYAVERFLEYTMEDEKSVLPQVREIQRIILEVKLEGKHLPDQF